MIVEALAATRAYWGEPPDDGMITFIDAGKVRHKRDPGRCFRRAGFVPAGETAAGLLIMRLPAEAMPAPEKAGGQQLALMDLERESGVG